MFGVWVTARHCMTQGHTTMQFCCHVPCRSVSLHSSKKKAIASSRLRTLAMRLTSTLGPRPTSKVGNSTCCCSTYPLACCAHLAKANMVYLGGDADLDLFVDLTDHNSVAAAQLKTKCMLNMASCQLRLGKNQECIDVCSEVLSTHPDNVKALYRRGQARLVLKQKDSAIADLRKALARYAVSQGSMWCVICVIMWPADTVTEITQWCHGFAGLQSKSAR